MLHTITENMPVNRPFTITENMPVNRPFEWLNNSAWEYLSSYAEDDFEYSLLDDMYRCIDGTISIREYKKLQDETRVTTEKLKQEYAKRFPVMMAHSLYVIADKIIAGRIVFDIDFSDVEPR